MNKVHRPTDAEIRQILLDAKDAGEAIRRLYELWKATHTKFSLAYLCNKAGIPSKGNLSDVMSGKRVLNMRYRHGIAKAFELTGDSGQCLRLLVEVAAEKNAERQAKTKRRLAVARKALKIVRGSMSARLSGLFFAMDVFCAFGLFKNKTTKQQLIGYFGSEKERELTEALQLLTEMSLIAHDPQTGYRLLSDHFVLGQSDDDLSHVDFIKQALANATANIERWFPDKKRSYFVSSVISVKEFQYESFIASLKERLLLMQADLESGDADMLIRLNMQVYPVA